MVENKCLEWIERKLSEALSSLEMVDKTLSTGVQDIYVLVHINADWEMSVETFKDMVTAQKRFKELLKELFLDYYKTDLDLNSVLVYSWEFSFNIQRLWSNWNTDYQWSAYECGTSEEIRLFHRHIQ